MTLGLSQSPRTVSHRLTRVVTTRDVANGRLRTSTFSAITGNDQDSLENEKEIQ